MYLCMHVLMYILFEPCNDMAASLSIIHSV